MKKILLIALLTGAFLTLNNVSAKAQISGAAGPGKNHLVSVIINPTFALTATSTVDSYTFATSTELTDGKTTIGAVSLGYSANAITKIMVSASTANFAGGPVGNPMPASVITVINGATTVPLSTTPTAIATSLAKGTGTVSLNYKVTPGLLYDPAADYALSIIYTLTSN